MSTPAFLFLQSTTWGPRVRRGAVVAAVVALVALAAFAPVAGAAAQPAPLRASAYCFGDARFEAGQFVEHSGDVFVLRVELCGADRRAVRFRGNGRRAHVVLDDANGDDVVTLLVNTFDPDEGFSVLAPGDDLTVDNDFDRGGPLSPGRYNLTMLAAFGYSPIVVDRANLTLRSPSLDGMAIYSGPPGAVDDLATPAGVRAALDDGTLDDRAPFRGDAVVVELRAAGYSGAVATRTGHTPAERFLRLVAGPLASLSARRTGGQAGDAPTALDYRPAARRLLVDLANDTFYLVVDTARLTRHPVDDPAAERPVAPGDAFLLNFSAPAGSPLATAGAASVTARLELRDRTADLDVETPVYLRPGRTLRVKGTTNARPGSRLAVTLRGDVERNRTVTVGPDRGFVAFFPLSNVTDGTDATLDLQIRNESLVGGGVAVHVDDPSASVTLRDQTVAPTDGRVVVEHVSLSRGGFVVLYRVGGDRVGASAYLPRGTHEAVNVTLTDQGRFDDGRSVQVRAVVHRDADRDREFSGSDPAYRSNETAVDDRATLAAPAGTPSPTPTPPPTDDTGIQLPDDPDDIPGFGPLTALVAFATLAALAAARSKSGRRGR